MANDRTQIEIERNMRKLDYFYVRKRESKGEARRRSGVRHAQFIKKDELARAVAACELDPSIVREGKEQLFEERYYASVFPNSDPYFYLPRYWLVWYVSRTARGYPERAYAKWLVTHFVWQRLAKILRSRRLKDVFADVEFTQFWKTCDAAFKAQNESAAASPNCLALGGGRLVGGCRYLHCRASYVPKRKCLIKRCR